MRRFVVTVFDGWVYDADTFSTDAFQELLASCDQLVIQAIVDAANGSDAKFNLKIETSSDGIRWTETSSIFENDDIVPVLWGFDAGGTPKMGRARLLLYLSGTDPGQAHVRVTVCGRDRSHSRGDPNALPDAIAPPARLLRAAKDARAAAIETTMPSDGSAKTTRSRAPVASCAAEGSPRAKPFVDSDSCACHTSTTAADLHAEPRAGALGDACRCDASAVAAADFDPLLGTPPLPAALPAADSAFMFARHAHAFVPQLSHRLAHDGFAVERIGTASSRLQGANRRAQLFADSRVQNIGSGGSVASTRRRPNSKGMIAPVFELAPDFDALIGTPPPLPSLPTVADSVVLDGDETFASTRGFIRDGFSHTAQPVRKAASRRSGTRRSIALHEPGFADMGAIDKASPVFSQHPFFAPPIEVTSSQGQPPAQQFQPKPFDYAEPAVTVPDWIKKLKVPGPEVLEFWWEPALAAAFPGPLGYWDIELDQLTVGVQKSALIVRKTAPPWQTRSWAGPSPWDAEPNLYALPVIPTPEVRVLFYPETQTSEPVFFAFDPQEVEYALRTSLDWSNEAETCDNKEWLTLIEERYLPRAPYMLEKAVMEELVQTAFEPFVLDLDPTMFFIGTPGPPASFPVVPGLGSVKAANLYSHGYCSYTTLENGLFPHMVINERLWEGIPQEFWGYGIKADDPTTEANEESVEPSAFRGMTRHYSRVVPWLGRQSFDLHEGGFYLTTKFDLHAFPGYISDAHGCFNMRYRYELDDGILIITTNPFIPGGVVFGLHGIVDYDLYFPTPPVGFPPYFKFDKFVPMTSAEAREALRAAVDAALREKVTAQFREFTTAQQRIAIGTCQQGAIDVTTGKGCQGALNLLLGKIEKGAHNPILQLEELAQSLGIDFEAVCSTYPCLVPVALIDRLKQSVSQWQDVSSLENTGYKHWRCVHTRWNAPTDCEDGFCMFALRAKRINIYPDSVELVWFDGDFSQELDNPMFALWVAAHDPEDQPPVTGAYVPPPAVQQLCSHQFAVHAYTNLWGVHDWPHQSLGYHEYDWGPANECGPNCEYFSLNPKVYCDWYCSDPGDPDCPLPSADPAACIPSPCPP